MGNCLVQQNGEPIGDWGNLPFLILDGCKEALEREKQGSSLAVLGAARLVNSWWSRWANGAVTSVTVSVRPRGQSRHSRPRGLPRRQENSSGALRTIASKFVNLRELKVDVWKGGDAGDLIWLQALEHFERLDLKIACLSNKVLQHIGGLTALTHLKIYKGPARDAKTLDIDLGHLDNLVTLKQVCLRLFDSISDAHLVHIGTWTGLRHLDISDSSQITDAGIQHVGQLTSLTHLDLHGCLKVGGGGVRHVAHMTMLLYLDLGQCHIPDSCMMGIGKLRTLTFLNLEAPRHAYRRADGHVSDIGFAHVDQLTCLKHLGIKKCTGITNMGIAHVGALASLTNLDMAYVGIIADSGLAIVGRLTALTGLSLKGCRRISNEGLGHIGRLTSLRTLALGGCRQVSDEGLLHIRKLTALTWLSLRQCKGITGAGLEHVSKLESLEYLDLRCVGLITNVHLARLGGLTMLQRLRLTNGDWGEGLRRLEQTLWDCRITMW
eukprot:evm.model.scf_433.1 EVM.evm.TU.scf_433.1   scf_433:16178-17945(+)